MNTQNIHDLTDNERAGFVWPMSDTLRMEAARVLWEEALSNEAFLDYRLGVGAVQFRHDLMVLVDPLHIGWHVHERAAGDAVLVPFDWEFTPWFLRSCVEFDPMGFITLKPDWLDLCRNVRGSF